MSDKTQSSHLHWHGTGVVSDSWQSRSQRRYLSHHVRLHLLQKLCQGLHHSRLPDLKGCQGKGPPHHVSKILSQQVIKMIVFINGKAEKNEGKDSSGSCFISCIFNF